MGFINSIGNGLLGLFGRGSERAFFTSTYQRFGQKGAVYLDTNTPYRLYNEIPQLQLVINKKAAMFANMVIKKQEIATGKFFDMPELAAILEHPNVLQSQNEFLRQYSCHKSVYGNSFMYKNWPSAVSKAPISISNISPFYIEPVLTGNVFDQVDMAGIVSEYRYVNSSVGMNANKTFKPEEILWTRVSDLDNPVMGTSPIKAIRFPVSNTKLAYDYLNIISGDKGAIGILSSQSKDSMGAIPMSTEDKKKIENSYRRNYGTGVDDDKMRIHVTEGSVTWSPMSYPTKDLLLLEQIDANMLTIIDHYGLNVNIFSSKNQTYENVKNALIQCYQDTIFVEADQFMQALTKFLNVEKGFKLVADYSHLAILSTQYQNLGQITQALSQAVQAGLLDATQAETIVATQLGVDVLDKKSNATLDALNKMSPLLASKVLDKLTTNQVLDLVGLEHVAGGDVPPTGGGAGFGGTA